MLMLVLDKGRAEIQLVQGSGPSIQGSISFDELADALAPLLAERLRLKKRPTGPYTDELEVKP